MRKTNLILTTSLVISIVVIAAFSLQAASAPDAAALHRTQSLEHGVILPVSPEQASQPVYQSSRPLRVADAASCKKTCQAKYNRCEGRCEDLYGDSPQGEGCKSMCGNEKRLCRKTC